MTDRRDEGGNELKDRFGSREAGIPLTCGEVRYSPAANRRISDAFDGGLELTSAGTMSGENVCLDFIGAQVSKLESGRVLFFIHGFNNTFEEAVRRAVTTAIDIEYDGLVVVWSWPSEGHAVDYWRDEDTIDFTRPVLEPFVEKLVRRSEIDRADFLFHSMGNRLGLWAVEKLLMKDDVLPFLGKIVFAAPDVARDSLGASLLRTPGFLSQRTLYAAKCDRPLEISENLHGGIRAGSGGHNDILLNEGMESVDVTDVETSCWWKLVPLTSLLPISHSYVFDTPEVINDLKLLLKGGRSPAGRNVSMKVRDGLPYKVLIEN